ncbi:uncharacterized protein [Ambystoma mexicanum]|uniref:uncharacterized protein n=1 Tax=Ambystoma mexicanum TaxID=8296 RepID=UPI0037E7AFD4
MIPTNLVLISPPGCYIRLATKSDIAWKFGIDILAGIIDPDIRGDVKVLLQNHGIIPFEVYCEDQIAQGIFERSLFPQFKESEPNQTERGALGFGEADKPSKIEEKKGEELTIYHELAFAQAKRSR